MPSYFTDYSMPRYDARRRRMDYRADQPVNPYMLDQGEPEQPTSGLPPELEAYLSQAAVDQRLAESKRSARSQALLGAGSAMLQAPDLMSGLGAAAGAFGEPMAAYRQEAREAPVQAALARYDISGTEQERGRARAQEERAAAGESRAVEGYEYGITRRPAEEESQDTANALNALRLRVSQIEEPFTRQRIEAELAQIEEQMNASRASVAASQANTQTENALRQPRVDLTNAQASTTLDQGEYYRMGGGRGRSGGITPTTVVNDWQQVLAQVERSAQAGFIPMGNDLVKYGAALHSMYNGLGLLDNPADRAAYGQKMAKVEEFKNDTMMLDDRAFEAKWGRDPIGMALMAFARHNAELFSEDEF